VFHPAFNVDVEDATQTVDRFDSHTRAVGKGVQGLRNIFGQVREARVGEPFSASIFPSYTYNICDIGMSQAERLLSIRFLSLISCKPLSSASTTGISGEEDEANDQAKGLVKQR